MEREEVMTLVRNHLSTELEVAPEKIQPETRFREDLDADSLDLYELVMELEDRYGIRVSEEEAADIETVGRRGRLRLRPGAGDRRSGGASELIR